jgi:ADP-ribosylglycohydrolase
MTSAHLAERFAGCLIGQCAGDAAGFLVEGQPRAVCAHFVETAVRGDRLHEYARGPFLFGQYSDDSQLARELLQSWVELRRFDAADYARRIAAIFKEERIVGRGRATEQAARRIAAGMSWRESGAQAGDAGNGSAMRAAPVGLLAGSDDELVAIAADQSRITHQDTRCLAGSAAVAGAVRQALHGAVDVAELASWVGRLDADFAAAVLRLDDWRRLSPADALPEILRASGGADRHWDAISPFVVPSVLWSLYSFLHTPDDYVETLCTAIGAGGDVDTTAAMAGAISGAHNGISAIPAAWAERLEDQGTWMQEELRALTEQASLLTSS